MMFREFSSFFQFYIKSAMASLGFFREDKISAFLYNEISFDENFAEKKFLFHYTV